VLLNHEKTDNKFWYLFHRAFLRFSSIYSKQMHNLIFIQSKLDSQSLGALQHRPHCNEQEETLLTIQLLTLSITYTQLILHMATYHTTFKVICLIWQNCIVGAPSNCCPDGPKHVGQFTLNKYQIVHLLE
jgi:hypothetical protein